MGGAVFWLLVLGLILCILKDAPARIGNRGWGYVAWAALLGVAATQGAYGELFPDRPGADMWYTLGGVIPVYLFVLVPYIRQAMRNPRRMDAMAAELLQRPSVVRFYRRTMSVWSSGKLSGISAGYEKAGKMAYEDFVKLYPPNSISALSALLNRFSPTEDEFLVSTDSGKPPNPRGGWFVLTNRRLIQWDADKAAHVELVLDGVGKLELPAGSGLIVCVMKNGESFAIENRGACPNQRTVDEVIGWLKQDSRAAGSHP